MVFFLLAPFSEVFLLRRTAPGVFIKGRWVEGATTETPVTGSVQQANDRDIQLLPEGLRTNETLKIFTEVEIKTENQPAHQSADVIVRKGVEYLVMSAATFGAPLPHWRVLARKIEGQ